jgi:hypothetical protein
MSDAHDRDTAAAGPIYDPSDAADRARAAQEYERLFKLEKMSDLHSRHTLEELAALFNR